MPFLRPGLSELTDRIRLDIEARLPGADSRLRRSVLDVFARVWAAGLSGLYGFADWISRQMLPDTADAEHLERWAAIWGVRRTGATIARGNILVTGNPGTVIPAGSQLARADGLLYQSIANAIVAADKSALVAVEALTSGASGLMLPGQSLQFTSPIIGAQAVALVDAGGLGSAADAEGDEALRSRLIERIRAAPHGGAKSDYVMWMKEVGGVTRAWVFPEWMGPGTVGCTFVMDGRIDIIPLLADIEAVELWLDERRPVTARPIVFAPTPVPLDLTLRVTPDTPEVRAAVAAEVADLLYREAQPGAADGSSVLLISHLREALSVAAGEYDHELVTPHVNIGVPAGSILVPGEIQWIAG